MNRIKLRQIARDFTMRRVLSALQQGGPRKDDALFNISPSLAREDVAEEPAAGAMDGEAGGGTEGEGEAVPEGEGEAVPRRRGRFTSPSLDARIFNFMSEAAAPPGPPMEAADEDGRASRQVSRGSAMVEHADGAAAERANIATWAAIADAHSRRSDCSVLAGQILGSDIGSASGFLNDTDDDGFKPTLWEKIRSCFVPDMTRLNITRMRFVERSIELHEQESRARSSSGASAPAAGGRSAAPPGASGDEARGEDEGDGEPGVGAPDDDYSEDDFEDPTCSERLEDAWTQLQYSSMLCFYRLKLYFLLFLRQLSHGCTRQVRGPLPRGPGGANGTNRPRGIHSSPLRIVDRPTDRLTDRPTDRSTNQSINQSIKYEHSNLAPLHFVT